MAVRVIRTGDACECDKCMNDAECLVFSRHKDKVMKCCFHHAEYVVQEHCPECTEVCANCSCELPIN